MRTDDLLTTEAVEFLTDLQREFAWQRSEALARRSERTSRLSDGELPDFLPETEDVRAGDLDQSNARRLRRERASREYSDVPASSSSVAPRTRAP